MNVIDNWSQNAQYYLGNNFKEVLAISEAHRFNVIINIICIFGLYIIFYLMNKQSQRQIINNYENKISLITEAL